MLVIWLRLSSASVVQTALYISDRRAISPTRFARGGRPGLWLTGLDCDEHVDSKDLISQMKGRHMAALASHDCAAMTADFCPQPADLWSQCRLSRL
jgi:hypothetical protein